MPLLAGSDLLQRARRDGYAVGAFSIHTPEMVEAVFAAAESLRAPVILQVGRRAVRNSGVEACCDWVRQRAATSPIPACLHLDHAQSFQAIIAGLRAGCTSIMYDGSDLPFADNIRETADVVRVCHAVGIPVEAEVGRVAGVEDDLSVEDAEARLAGPADCARFVAETGCDVLAPAIGNVHGLSASVPTLRLDLLRAVAAAVPLPLVLHGGSGLDPAQITGAVSAGIAKINIDTELRRAFMQALEQGLPSFAAQDDPAPALAAAAAAVSRQVQERMRQFGSAGRG